MTLLKSTGQGFGLSHNCLSSAYLAGIPQKWYCVPFSRTGGTWCWFVPILVMLTLITVADSLWGGLVIPTSGVHTLCDPFLQRGWDLWLNSNQENTTKWQDVCNYKYMITLHSFHLTGVSSLLLAMRKKIATLENPCGKELQTASRSCRQTPAIDQEKLRLSVL